LRPVRIVSRQGHNMKDIMQHSTQKVSASLTSGLIRKELFYIQF